MDQMILERPDMVASDPWTIPLDRIDVGQAALFQANAFWPFFERLRRDAPVHYCAIGEFGPYWSITKYKHIMQIEANHEVFSSDVTRGGITLRDQLEDFVLPMFIAMDPPKHDWQRAAVNPIVSPTSLARLEVLIRERAAGILDNLPIGETFNWVDRVSIELTTQMLATLFDFPWEDRRKLTRWSDVATATPGGGIIEDDEQRKAELLECLQYFLVLWNERVNAPRHRRSDFHDGARGRHAGPEPDGVFGQSAAADRGRERHHAQFDYWRPLRAEQISWPVYEAAGKPWTHSEYGAGNHPLADAAGAYAAHRDAGFRIRGRQDPRGRSRGDVVRLGQPRSGSHPGWR